MSFANFVKKHFPLEHSKVSGKLAKILGRPKKRKARTISGFTGGQEVEFTWYNLQWNSSGNSLERIPTVERGTVTRVYGETVFIRSETFDGWPHRTHMNNVRAV